ncbi:receptor-type tyrosine-protein phosphatase alpha-like isoform X1 [Diadema antillarum]|uniref:receptor-type tyrosine-protein phosphatase alpha-like isoform X1 n=1 Tax=Diadema antillarum TaxID=105358 RepID=UPI003A8783A2
MPNGRDQTNGSVPMVNLGIDEVDEMIVKPIPLQNLEKEIRRKSQEERKIFWAEYKALPNKTPAMVTVHASNHPANKEKNRYINIIAYDHTRVKLRTIDSIEGSDYINASYVNGYESPDKFIAAQGPKENTVDDFWRMIWEQNCSTIVMLTKCVEDGRDKCYQYWPSKGTMKCGKLLVTMDNVQQTAEYVIRSLVLQEDGKDNQRSITQFHFLGWPDHGQPDYPSPMLCLIKRVRHLTSKINKRANIVVHCSAGVGRTGTYIVIDAMMDMMKREKKVDIYNFIYEIRQQRNTLVQSFIQYFFIHMALLEEYMFGHTDISVQAVPEYYANLGKASQVDEHLSNLELEFRRAARLPVNKVEQKFANVEANKEKNRIGHILPYDKNVVKLERLIGVEYSDYINASFITGYQRKEMYIATQGPLTNTIGDFWRMVWASETSTIVMLTEISQRGQEMCAQYWPVEDGEEVQHGDIAVKLEGEEEEDVFTIRNISISQSQVSQLIYDNVDNEESEETEALYGNVPKTTTKDVRYIRQFHYRDWPEVGVPESGLDLIKLVNKAHLHQSEHGPHPIVVHCSAGAGRTGVFLALSILMERMEKETMVDVFQTVRSLRQQRPHMVQDLAQYKFCYSALTEYIQDQSTEYQNFVPREV